MQFKAKCASHKARCASKNALCACHNAKCNIKNPRRISQTAQCNVKRQDVIFSLIPVHNVMLPMDHFVSRFLYFTTTGVKCRVAAVKSCPVLHFSVIFIWSFGIIDTSTITCWALSTAQASTRGREEYCTYSFSLMYRLSLNEPAIFM
jgi:hypothetical protein